MLPELTTCGASDLASIPPLTTDGLRARRIGDERSQMGQFAVWGSWARRAAGSCGTELATTRVPARARRLEGRRALMPRGPARRGGALLAEPPTFPRRASTRTTGDLDERRRLPQIWRGRKGRLPRRGGLEAHHHDDYDHGDFGHDRARGACTALGPRRQYPTDTAL